MKFVRDLEETLVGGGIAILIMVIIAIGLVLGGGGCAHTIAWHDRQWNTANAACVAPADLFVRAHGLPRLPICLHSAGSCFCHTERASAAWDSPYANAPHSYDFILPLKLPDAI